MSATAGGASGPPRDVEALVAEANELMAAGRFDGAAEAFDSAAARHAELGESHGEAIATRFAATMWRMAGRPHDSIKRARRSLELVPPGSPAGVAALTEIGEAWMAAQDAAAAAAAYDDAIAAGAAAGMPPTVEAGLSRRRAAALAAAGQAGEAAEVLRRARELHEAADDPAQALATLVEEVTVLQGAGATEAADRARLTARRSAEHSGDAGALAQIELLEATRALELGEGREALAAANAARAHALEAVDAVAYTGAVIVAAELHESAGDLFAAYEALAVGYATLGDLLGRDVAKATFEAKLVALRQRWGAESFGEVKATYERRRREKLATDPDADSEGRRTSGQEPPGVDASHQLEEPEGRGD